MHPDSYGIRRIIFRHLALAAAFFSTAVMAGQDEELAKKLANPVASLISVPIDIDFDSDLGPLEQGERTILVAKPVVPFSLNANWNLITRTVIPYISLEDFAPPVGDESGLGDIQASFFFSPKAPTAGGWIWGAGPIVLLPTASEDVLGSEKWGLGPTGVALRQQGPWTYGMLANHVWSFAGDDNRQDYDRTFIQPFVTYTTPTAMSFTLQTESSYDWETEEWTVPVNFVAAQVTKVGSQLLQVRGGLRYWADSPSGVGPEGWGLRLGISLLFPR
jgi:hypothetical protein